MADKKFDSQKYNKNHMSIRFPTNKVGMSKEDFLELVEKSGKNATQYVIDKIFGSDETLEEMIIEILIEFIKLSADLEEKFGHEISFSYDFPTIYQDLINNKYLDLAKERLMKQLEVEA